MIMMGKSIRQMWVKVSPTTVPLETEILKPHLLIPISSRRFRGCRRRLVFVVLTFGRRQSVLGNSVIIGSTPCFSFVLLLTSCWKQISVWSLCFAVVLKFLLKLCIKSKVVCIFKAKLTTSREHSAYIFLNYHKFPKYSDTPKICCNQSKIWTMWLYRRVMSPNDADGMANSVDPDQTAPRSSLIWVGTLCPGISVQKLRIITVIAFQN